jgi:hypothetical protein
MVLLEPKLCNDGLLIALRYHPYWTNLYGLCVIESVRLLLKRGQNLHARQPIRQLYSVKLLAGMRGSIANVAHELFWLCCGIGIGHGGNCHKYSGLLFRF